jgi:hypothetical protein
VRDNNLREKKEKELALVKEERGSNAAQKINTDMSNTKIAIDFEGQADVKKGPVDVKKSLVG